MLVEAGVQVLLHCQCVSVVVEDGRVRGVITESKAGREAWLAKVTIDCTGDADIAARAGVVCDMGGADGGLQPPTLMFCLAGVDTERLRMSIAERPRTYLTDFIPNDYFGQNR